MKTKKCTRCKKRYPADRKHFKPANRSSDGLQSWCRNCSRLVDRKYSRQYRKDHPEWKRADNEKRAEQMIKLAKEWRKKHPEIVRCYKIYNKALRNRTLKKKPCQICGNPKSEGHHEDYSKPLKVIWLCDKHHREVHSLPIE